jgi:ATP synthase protein I
MKESDSSKERQEKLSRNLRREVLRKESRKIKGQREKERGVWFGLGMFGLIGWSVAIPTLVGLGIGIWIDSRWPGRHSWTLMGLVTGVALGCLNAWLWVKREMNRD